MVEKRSGFGVWRSLVREKREESVFVGKREAVAVVTVLVERRRVAGAVRSLEIESEAAIDESLERERERERERLFRMRFDIVFLFLFFFFWLGFWADGTTRDLVGENRDSHVRRCALVIVWEIFSAQVCLGCYWAQVHCLDSTCNGHIWRESLTGR